MGASRNAATLTDFFTFLWNPETSPHFCETAGEVFLQEHNVITD
jgi:hypothetical protein